jgi:hypothetical protein
VFNLKNMKEQNSKSNKIHTFDSQFYKMLIPLLLLMVFFFFSHTYLLLSHGLGLIFQILDKLEIQ